MPAPTPRHGRSPFRHVVVATCALALALALSACGGTEAPEDAASSAPSRTAPSKTAPTKTAPSPSSQSPSASASAAPDRVSLPAYFTSRREYDGRDLRLGAVRERTSRYTSYDATFRSDDLRISGVIDVPRGPGPFPAVVLAHGYIDPAVYVRGQGMTRERGYLAARGLVALHVDYRAHAESDGSAQRAERRVRLGYVADVINAAGALRRTGRIPVDDTRVSLMGRSMGGGVVYRALGAAPGVFDAGIAWAAVSSLEQQNFERWSRDDPALVAYLDRTHGLPGTKRGRQFWAGVSARTYFDRISEPVLVIQGGADETCPPRWARASQRALLAAGVDSTLAWYPDEGHAFGPRFDQAMDRSVRFLGRARARLSDTCSARAP